MTTKYWTGGSSSFDNGMAWSPQGAPVNGDVAVVGSGTVAANYATLDGGTVDLAGPTESAAPTLDLRYSVLGAGETVTTSGVTTSNPVGYGRILAEGSNQNRGAIQASFGGASLPGALTIDIADTTNADGSAASGASFVNAGTIASLASTVTFQGGSADALLINNGLLSDNGSMEVGVPVTGSGTIDAGLSVRGAPASLTLADAVGEGQTVVADGHVALQDPADFHAVIADFNTGYSEIALPGTVTSVHYDGDHNGGRLTLYSGSTVAGTLTFVGDYAPDQFRLATGPQSVLTVAGTSGGGGGSSGGSGGSAGGPEINVPSSEQVAAGGSVAVAGVSVADSFAASNPGMMALNVTDGSGTLRMTDSAGNKLPGSGTGAIH